jgi:hypothetical protein
VAGWTGTGRAGLAVTVVSKPPTPRRALQLAEIVYTSVRWTRVETPGTGPNSGSLGSAGKSARTTALPAVYDRVVLGGRYEPLHGERLKALGVGGRFRIHGTKGRGRPIKGSGHAEQQVGRPVLRDKGRETCATGRYNHTSQCCSNSRTSESDSAES